MESEQRSLFSSVVSGVKWVGLGIVAQGALRVGLLAVMARLVPPRDFGIMAIALIFTSFAERLGQVGVGPAFVQRAVIDERDLKTASILSVVSGCLITLALCGIAPFAATFFEEPVLRSAILALSIGFVIDSFGVVSDGLLQRELKFREIVRVETISLVFGSVGVGIALGYLGFGLWALIGANLAMRLVKTSLLVCARPVSLRGRWSASRARELLSMGIGFSLGKILNFLSLQGDNLVVGRLLGAEALGMYTRAYQAMTLPAMYVGQAFERVLFPALSRKQDDSAALRGGLLSTLEISTLVALPTSVGMCFLSPEIVLVLFGEVWRPVIPVLSVLSCGVFFRAAYKCSDVLIRSKGDVYAYAARQACYTAVIVFGSLIGALFGGLRGVSYAVVIGVVVNYALMTLLAGRLAGASLRELARCHLPGIWISGWIGCALWIVVPYLRAQAAAPILILTMAMTTAVCVAVVAWSVSGPIAGRSNARLLALNLIRRRARLRHQSVC